MIWSSNHDSDNAILRCFQISWVKTRRRITITTNAFCIDVMVGGRKELWKHALCKQKTSLDYRGFACQSSIYKCMWYTFKTDISYKRYFRASFYFWPLHNYTLKTDISLERRFQASLYFWSVHILLKQTFLQNDVFKAAYTFDHSIYS